MTRQPNTLLTGLLVATMLSACGYQGTTLTADVNARARTDGSLEQGFATGFADPDPSAFDRGLLLYARWTVSRQEVRTVELFLDIDRAALPSEVLPTTDSTLTDAAGEVVGTVRYRMISGKPKSQHTPSAVDVTIDEWSEAGLRHISSGTFVVAMPTDEGIYTSITGSWLTGP